MNKLSSEERAEIVRLLSEGESIRTISLLTGASKNTVAKLLTDAGMACMTSHDANVVNVSAKHIQVDEIWSFTYGKETNVASATTQPKGVGEVWTWTARERETNLIISYFVGRRDRNCAKSLMDDLRSRLASRAQLTSDGGKVYLEALAGEFGDDVDGGTLEGHSGARNNPTGRISVRRFAPAATGFSKRGEHYAYAVALHTMYHNFVRAQSNLGITPAMAAGLSDRPWDADNIVAIMEAAERGQTPQGL